MSKQRKVGDRVYIRSRFNGSLFTGDILKIRRTLFGKSYLLQYRVHDLDFDYHYETTKWFNGKRLI
jgi:hypothetical protein